MLGDTGPLIEWTFFVSVGEFLPQWLHTQGELLDCLLDSDASLYYILLERRTLPVSDESRGAPWKDHFTGTLCTLQEKNLHNAPTSQNTEG